MLIRVSKFKLTPLALPKVDVSTFVFGLSLPEAWILRDNEVFTE